MMGVSAAFLRRGRHGEFARRSIRLGMIAALVGAAASGGTGHWHAMQVARCQPLKLAAGEGIYKTQKGAPLMLFGIPDSRNRTVHWAVRIPKLLSLLATGDLNGEVKGLESEPNEDNWPPVELTFWAFHVMVGLGLFFLALPAWGLWRMRKGKLADSPGLLTLMLWSIPLPLLASQLGWMAVEVGRQPWIVYGVMRTADAASPASVVPAWQVLTAIIAFAVVYAALLVLWIYLIRRIVRAGPATAEAPDDSAPAPRAPAG